MAKRWYLTGHSLNEEVDYSGVVEAPTEAVARLVFRRGITDQIIVQYRRQPIGVPYLVDTRYITCEEIVYADDQPEGLCAVCGFGQVAGEMYDCRVERKNEHVFLLAHQDCAEVNGWAVFPQ